MGIPTSQKKKDAGHIPGPQNVPSVIEIRCQLMMPNSKLSFMTFHGAYTTAPGNIQTMANTLFTSLSGAWGTNMAPVCPPATSFQSVQVRDMASYLNPVSIGTGTAVPGTSASVALPAEVAIVLTENVASRGRGLKGRAYLGGLAQNASTAGGLISAAGQSAANGFGTAVFNAIGAVALTPCVAQVARAQYQGYTGTVHPARNASHVNVTSYTCRDLNFDSQRRRGQP